MLQRRLSSLGNNRNIDVGKTSQVNLLKNISWAEERVPVILALEAETEGPVAIFCV